MATYVLLTTLTPEGRQTLHKNPDRLVEVNKKSNSRQDQEDWINADTLGMLQQLEIVPPFPHRTS